MTAVARDDSGFVRGFSYHDGYLDGLVLGDAGTVYLGLRAQSGERRVLTLRGVEALSVHGLREGNIVLNLRVVLAATAGADAEMARLLSDRLYLEPRDLAADVLLFRLECSFGAEILAVCADVEVSAPGASLGPSGLTA